MILGQRITLNPNSKQINMFIKAVGVSRFSYNWALTEWKRQYDLGLKPTAFGLCKQFNKIKKEEFPWVYESPKDANQRPFLEVETAFKNFFNSRTGKRKGPKIGYPTLKKKGINDSFYLSNITFKFTNDGRKVVLPRIGSVKIHEPLRFKGKILNGRIRRIADRWYLSVQVQLSDYKPKVKINRKRRSIIGVDLGVKTAIVTSDGQKIDSPNPLKASLKKLKKANKHLHRCKKGSKNRYKKKNKVARIHHHISNIRSDFMHKVTTKLCRENQAIVIEDLNVKGMLKK